MSKNWDVSVCICTYNRCQGMRSALESVLGQQADGVRFEVIVVDNNSTDETKQVVDSFVRRGHSNLRYVFEGRQGLSYARNAAIAVAGSPLVAFTDDDIRVAPDWVSTIKRVFDEHPEAAWVGGKVLPCWPSAPPRWLTGDDWGPLALADHGDLPFYTSDRRQTCLVGANLAVRLDVLAQCGGFAPRLQRVKDSIGSMEDHELQMRLWRANRKGLYVPELVVFSDLAADRLLKKYYRRWHFGHGRFYALARLEEYERSNVGWLFGVSAHVYRRAIGDAVGWLASVIRGNFRRAFTYEKSIWFFLGFLSVHYKEFLEHGHATHVGELSRFGWVLTRRLFRRPTGGRALTKQSGM
jgi:glycosyltransferase involved in cell wall biosynthesis